MAGQAMKTEQTPGLSADLNAWQSQTRQEFKAAIRTLHSKMNVPTSGWAIMAIVEIAMRYALDDEQPEGEK